MTGVYGSKEALYGDFVYGDPGVPTYYKDANDTLSFTESATLTSSRGIFATDTITFVDDVQAGVFNLDASDTQSFTEVAFGRVVIVKAATDTETFTEVARGNTSDKTTDTLTFTDSAKSAHTYLVSASDTQTFTETRTGLLLSEFNFATDTLSIFESVSGSLPLLRQQAESLKFTDSAQSGFKTKIVSQEESIAFTESAKSSFQYPGHDTITITEIAASDLRKQTKDSISFTDIAVGLNTHGSSVDLFTITDKSSAVTVHQTKQVSDFFSIAENARASFLHTVTTTDTITFTDQAVKDRYVKVVTDTLSMFDTATSKRSLRRVVSDTITFTESIPTSRTYVRAAADTITFAETRFDPSEGVFVPATIGIKIATNFVLITPAGTISLPRPEYGDSENTTNDFNLRYSRTGQPYTIVHRRRLNRRLVYTFNLSRRKERELLQVLSAANDKFMSIVNWKGEQWKVKLLSNPIQSNNIGFDRFRVELEFEGIQLTSGGVNTCQC